MSERRYDIGSGAELIDNGHTLVAVLRSYGPHGVSETRVVSAPRPALKAIGDSVPHGEREHAFDRAIEYTGRTLQNLMDRIGPWVAPVEPRPIVLAM